MVESSIRKLQPKGSVKDIRDFLGKTPSELFQCDQFFKMTKQDKSNPSELKQLDVDVYETKTGNPKGIYHNCRDKGISVFVPEGKEHIEFMTFYNRDIEAYKQFDLPLPMKLNWSLVNQDIIRKFGDTVQKGGGSIPVWLNYEHLGIGFTFLNSSWDDASNPLTHVTVFIKPQEPQKHCSMCLKAIEKNSAQSQVMMTQKQKKEALEKDNFKIMLNMLLQFFLSKLFISIQLIDGKYQLKCVFINTNIDNDIKCKCGIAFCRMECYDEFQRYHLCTLN